LYQSAKRKRCKYFTRAMSAREQIRAWTAPSNVAATLYAMMYAKRNSSVVSMESRRGKNPPSKTQLCPGFASQLGLLRPPVRGARGGRRTLRPNPDRHGGGADARTRFCTAPRTPKCGSRTILQVLVETARMQEMWKNAEATARRPICASHAGSPGGRRYLLRTALA
jgi:hypothetical protein